jgi:cytochrome P450
VTDANVAAALLGVDRLAELERLRAEQPVFPLALPDGTRIWLLTRYDDARRALTDPCLSNQLARGALLGNESGPTSQHMLVSDPPDHTRLRRLVSAGFTARRIERLEPRIAAIADVLLDTMAGRDEVDLIEAYAFPLPIQVICELLGVPSTDRDDFRSWSNAVVAGTLSTDPGLTEQSRTAMGRIVDYIGQLLAAKRRTPGDDLLSALLEVHDQGDRLTENELVSMVFLMLIAGHETTLNLIGNGVYLLLTHPDQRRRIEEDPSLLPSAIEEFLRYESPLQATALRLTTQPVHYSGVTIPAHQPVLISLASANRDDTAIPDPDRFDIARQGVAHVAFGHGIHFCLGAALARLEGRIAITALLHRYPGLHLAHRPDDLTWRPNLFIRGLARLPIRLTPRPAPSTSA